MKITLETLGLDHKESAMARKKPVISSVPLEFVTSGIMWKSTMPLKKGSTKEIGSDNSATKLNDNKPRKQNGGRSTV